MSEDVLLYPPRLSRPRVLARRANVLVLRLDSRGGAVVVKAGRSGAPRRTRRALLREALIGDGLRHENVAHLVDGLTMRDAASPGQMALVMQDAGQTLRELVSEFRLRLTSPPLSLVRLLGAQLLSGLRYLHAVGLAHCDVKPTNVGVDANLRLRLFDFGQARLINAPNQPLSRGTRFYRAPEILAGEEPFSGAVDVWSAACVFLDLLLPDLPERRPDEEEEHIRRLSGGSMKLLDSCDRLAASLTTRMLRVRPEERPTAADALEHPFFHGVSLRRVCRFKPLPGHVHAMLAAPDCGEGRRELREKIVDFLEGVEARRRAEMVN